MRLRQAADGVKEEITHITNIKFYIYKLRHETYFDFDYLIDNRYTNVKQINWVNWSVRILWSQITGVAEYCDNKFVFLQFNGNSLITK